MKRTITEIFIEVEEIISVNLKEDSSVTFAESEKLIVVNSVVPQVCSICRRAISNFCEKTIEQEKG